MLSIQQHLSYLLVLCVVLSKFNGYSSIVVDVFVCMFDLCKDGTKSIKKERERRMLVSEAQLSDSQAV